MSISLSVYALFSKAVTQNYLIKKIRNKFHAYFINIERQQVRFRRRQKQCSLDIKINFLCLQREKFDNLLD